jgi:FMN reductase
MSEAAMSYANIIGFSGNITRPSKTFALVDRVVQDIARATGLAGRTYDIEDLGPSLLRARNTGNFDAQAQDILKRILASDILVVGSPTYKGSYTGLFKHFFDLVDPAALRGKPVVLTATGGGDRHALIVEHALRPLFGFFETLTLPTAIYASERDFADGKMVAEATLWRVSQAVAQAAAALKSVDGFALAAE